MMKSGGNWNFYFFSSRRRHTRYIGDWSSDVCSSDLGKSRTARSPVSARRLYRRWAETGSDRSRPRRGSKFGSGPPDRPPARRRPASPAVEIGRASCRERVQISELDVPVRIEESEDEQ